MIDLRNNPPKEINGEKIVLIEDYQSSIAKNIQDYTETTIDIPKSNVLIFYTESGSKIAARPSGTEPKIKFYISVQSTLKELSDFNAVQKELDNKISSILKNLSIK